MAPAGLGVRTISLAFPVLLPVHFTVHHRVLPALAWKDPPQHLQAIPQFSKWCALSLSHPHPPGMDERKARRGVLQRGSVLVRSGSAAQ